MNINKRNISGVLLLLGMISLTIGIAIDNTIFSFAAVIFILLSLILGGRWLRPRKK